MVLNMNNRSTSSKTSNLFTKRRKVSLETNRYHNTSSPRLYSESRHNKCLKKDSQENIKTGVGMSKSQMPKLPTGQKKSLLQKRPSLKSTPSVNLNKSLSQEGIQALASKFKDLSSSILKLTTLQKPVSMRSLEAFLTREIESSLENMVTSPSFSHNFIQATRNMLDSLVSEYENDLGYQHQIRDLNEASQLQLTSVASSSSVCFRDKYFEDLVMNVVHNRFPEQPEVNSKDGSTILSSDSRYQTQSIRNLVNGKASIEREELIKIQKELEDIRRSLSQNQLKMLQAAREVEKVISEHLVNHGSPSNCRIISGIAIEALKSPCERRQKKETGEETEDCKSEKKYGSVPNSGSSSFCKELTIMEYLNSAPKFRESLKILGLDNDYVKSKNEDLLKNIRPQIEKLLQDELNRAVEQSNQILNKEVKCAKEVCSNDSLDSSSGSLVLSDDDEISEEETKVFLVALRADIDEKRKDLDNLSGKIDRALTLEGMDEDFRGDEKIETLLYVEGLGTSTEKSDGIIENPHNSDFETKTLTLGQISSTVPQNLLESPNNLDCSSICKEPETILSSHETNKIIENETLLKNVKSQWWSADHSVASEIMSEMRKAFEKLKLMHENTGRDHKSLEGEVDREEYKKEPTHLFHENEFDFTVEEMANVLMKISVKIKQLPIYLQATEPSFSSSQQNQVFTILTILENCLNGVYPLDPDFMVPLKDEGQLSMSVESVSETFSFMSGNLRKTPSQLKTQPISVLNPPESLTKTLAVLSSTGYFKDCFICVRSEENKCTSYQKVNNNICNDLGKSSTEYTEVESEIGSVKSNKDVVIVKSYNIDENTSSKDVFSYAEEDLTLKSTNTFKQKARKSEDISKNLASFEHYLGLTVSVMTVQNVSDMFLYLATVLNDVPERIKSEKILKLNPPNTILRALDILYEDEKNSLAELENKTSYASLTVQDVADFFLTVSKSLQDTPPRLKNSTVIDLDPPQSLIKAINLLTSLSHNSVLESSSYEEAEEEGIAQFRCKTESQEKFFDAVDSFASTSNMKITS